MKSSVAFIGLVPLIARAMAAPADYPSYLLDTEIRFTTMVSKTKSLCIEDRGGLRIPNNPVQLAECDFEKAREQKWQYINGAIHLSPSTAESGPAYCLDLRNDSGTRGSDEARAPEVVVNLCDDRPTQKWRLVQDPDFDYYMFKIQNNAMNKCLEAIEGDDLQDRQLVFNPCSEVATQLWTEVL